MKPANQSDKLTEFYRAWFAWAEGGENVHGFDKRFGLCSSAFLFGGHEILSELTSQFRGIEYPFDKDERAYNAFKDSRNNPKRLQWCRDHI